MAAFTTKTTRSAFRAGSRRAGAAGAGLVLALVLTGCGGGDEPAARDGGAATESGKPSPSKPAKSAKSAKPSPSATTKGAAGTGAGALSGAELAAVLSEVNTDLDIGGTVLEEAQLKQNTAQGVEALKGVEYSPCNPTEGIDPTKALREASMGALAIEGNAPGMPDTISVISWSSEEAVAEESKMSKRQFASCPEYSLTANGRTVSLAGEALDMPTVGDASQAYVTRQSIDGVAQTSVVLTAWSGTSSVQITLHEADPQDSIRYVARILEEVLDRVEG
ncbi:hypothetical protein [Arthrobacter sp. zg-Y1110]|uniref:hypothetical protein n=1 Tax=Arthrobacter sp. zg-Y1110 TaxID=2886932 RepID=UPI001D151C45|nr:hypothetical protein [Arthrobacter sp. zg-Y1110]MCC3292713.1 hypothetical protein [Arthrobacter sp. zg-Y1110]UWX85992.1 hypothetical protein N2K99_05565 [Arthrobacter sp. zg-Y1110]